MPKLIAPKPYNTTAIQQAIDLGLLAAGAVAKAEFLLFTASWSTENTPIWSEEGPKTSRGDRVWRYTTDSTPMVWVDDGTPEHPITAVNFTIPFPRYVDFPSEHSRRNAEEIEFGHPPI